MDRFDRISGLAGRTRAFRVVLLASARLLLASLALSAMSACGEEPREGRRLQFNGFALEDSPGEFPDLIPVSFRYPEARIRKTAVYDRDPFLSSTQGALVFESDDSPEAIESFYREAFAVNGWQLIQTHAGEGERLLMAESPSRRLFTVIIRGSSPASVKAYIKQASLL